MMLHVVRQGDEPGGVSKYLLRTTGRGARWAMSKTTLDLQLIGNSGGGMIIDSRGKTTLDLQQIAASAKGTVVIRHASTKSTLDCQQIAASGQGRVVFDFTD
jgi:hypothetical protein